MLVRLGTLLWLIAATTGVWAMTPTCEELVEAVPAALREAREVVVSVTLEQGGREIAFERSRILRAQDGGTTVSVLERRGLRRPGGTGGPPGDGGRFEWPCDDHALLFRDDGHVELRLRHADPDAPVAEWLVRLVASDGRWRPVELVATFTVRVLLVAIRGRIVTTFDAWRFGDP